MRAGGIDNLRLAAASASRLAWARGTDAALTCRVTPTMAKSEDKVLALIGGAYSTRSVPVSTGIDGMTEAALRPHWPADLSCIRSTLTMFLARLALLRDSQPTAEEHGRSRRCYSSVRRLEPTLPPYIQALLGLGQVDEAVASSRLWKRLPGWVDLEWRRSGFGSPPGEAFRRASQRRARADGIE